MSDNDPDKRLDPANLPRIEGRKPRAKRPGQDAMQNAERGGSAASKLAARMRKQREEQERELRADREREYVYYVECPEPDCKGPGIWIFKDPKGVLEPRDWEASFKPRGMPWMAYNGMMPPIPCQVCYGQGRTVALEMFHHDGKPVANRRHVRRILTLEYEALMAGEDVEVVGELLDEDNIEHAQRVARKSGGTVGAGVSDV